MELDFRECKTKEDVAKVFAKNKVKVPTRAMIESALSGKPST